MQQLQSRVVGGCGVCERVQSFYLMMRMELSHRTETD